MWEMVTLKRAILMGVCAAAVGLGPLAIASSASADGSCPYGTVPTRFSGVCTSGVAGGAPSGPTVPIPPGSSSSSGPPGTGFTTVDGIPCNSAHASTCIALSQSQPHTP
jgi:hypothetical protein